MKILNNFMKWQNYVHYLLLALALLIIMKYQSFNGLKGYLILTGFLLVIDSLIHIIFAVLPEPLKWDD